MSSRIMISSFVVLTFAACGGGKSATKDQEKPTGNEATPVVGKGATTAAKECKFILSTLPIAPADRKALAEFFISGCTNMSKQERTCLDKVDKNSFGSDKDACFATLLQKSQKKDVLFRYINKAKTSEARAFVKKIYDGARSYYMDPPSQRGTNAATPPQFPYPSQGATPPWGACCKNASKKCEPSHTQWETPVWTALQFSVDDPHYFSYSYKVSDKYKEFTAIAYGDLDCDGVYSTFMLTGKITPEFSDGPTGSPKLIIKDELE